MQVGKLNKELLFGSFFAFIMKGLYAIGTFLLYVVVSRSLGVKEAGYFFLVQTIIVIAAFLIRQGLDNVIVRYVAGYHISGDSIKISGIYKLALFRVLLLGLIVVPLLWYLSYWISDMIFNKPDLTLALKVGWMVVIPLAVSQLHGFFFQGKKQVIRAMSFESVLLSLISVIAFFIMKPKTAVDALSIYFFIAMLICVFSFFLWNYNLQPRFSTLDNCDKKAVLSTAKPLFIVVVLVQITQWAGQLLLGVLGSTEQVAIFSAAQRTAMLTSFILVAVNAIAAPKFAEAYKLGNHSEIERVSLVSCRIMTAFALPVAAFMLFFSSFIMSLFGDDFIDGYLVLQILVLGQVINVVTGSVGYLLQMTGHEKSFRDSVFCSTVLMVVCCLIFIPIWGVYGAAWSTTIAVATQNLLCVYHVRRKLGFNTLNIFFKKYI